MKIITVNAVKRILIVVAFALVAYVVLSPFCCVIEVSPYLVKKTPKVEFVPAQYGQGELTFDPVYHQIPILILRGTPQEMGEQQGNLLKPQLQALVEEYLNRFLHKDSIRNVAQFGLTEMKPFVPPEYRQEIEALGKASGINPDRILLLHTIIDEPSVPYCSVIIASGPATAKGDLIMGRNLDFISLGVAEKYSLIMVYHPDGKKAFASITWPGFVGTLTGINEDGLSLALLLSMSSWPTEDSGTPSLMIFRKVLEEASTVEQAIKIVQDAKRVSPMNLALADADKNSAVLEITARKIAIRYPEQGVLKCTNWFESKEMSTGGGDGRLTTIGRLTQKYYGKIGLAETIDILKSVALFRINLQSMVFYPSERVIYLSIGSTNAAQGEFREIDLAPYLKAK